MAENTSPETDKNQPERTERNRLKRALERMKTAKNFPSVKDMSTSQNTTNIHNLKTSTNSTNSTNVNIGNIVFTQVELLDQSPAEEDKARRITKKNVQLAEKMEKALTKIAKNTKPKAQQDIEIKQGQKDQKNQIINQKIINNQITKIMDILGDGKTGAKGDKGANGKDSFSQKISDAVHAASEKAQAAAAAANKNKTNWITDMQLWWMRMKFHSNVLIGVGSIFAGIGKSHFKFFGSLFSGLAKVGKPASGFLVDLARWGGGIGGKRGFLFDTLQKLLRDPKKFAFDLLKSVSKKNWIMIGSVVGVGIIAKAAGITEKQLLSGIKTITKFAGKAAGMALGDLVHWWRHTSENVPFYISKVADWWEVLQNDPIKGVMDLFGGIKTAGKFLVEVLGSVKDSVWDQFFKPILANMLSKVEIGGVNLAEKIWADDLNKISQNTQDPNYQKDLNVLRDAMSNLSKTYQEYKAYVNTAIRPTGRGDTPIVNGLWIRTNRALQELKKQAYKMFGKDGRSGKYTKPSYYKRHLGGNTIKFMQKEVGKLISIVEGDLGDMKESPFGNGADIQKFNELNMKTFSHLGKLYDYEQSKLNFNNMSVGDRLAMQGKIDKDERNRVQHAEDSKLTAKRKKMMDEKAELVVLREKRNAGALSKEELKNFKKRVDRFNKKNGLSFYLNPDDKIDRYVVKARKNAKKVLVSVGTGFQEGFETTKIGNQVTGSIKKSVAKVGNITKDAKDKMSGLAGAVTQAVTGGSDVKRAAYMVRKNESRNNYSAFNPNDAGRGPSLGAYQFTMTFGGPYKILKRLADQAPNSGAQSYLSQIRKQGNTYVYTGSVQALGTWWKQVGNTKVARNIQDDLFQESYYNPAVAAAKKAGITCSKCILHFVDHKHNRGSVKALMNAANNSKSVAAARIKDYQSLKGWSKYGKGWAKRVANIEGVSLSNLTKGSMFQGVVDKMGNFIDMGKNAVAGGAVGAMMLAMLDKTGIFGPGGTAGVVSGLTGALTKGFGALGLDVGSMTSKAGSIAGSIGKSISDYVGLGGSGPSCTNNNKILDLKGYKIPLGAKNFACCGADHGPRKTTGYLVLHRTAGKSYAGIYPRKCKDGTSAHFTIEKNGTINLDVRDDHIAYHVKGFNFSSVGIEIVGAWRKDLGTYEPITKPQAKSIMKLSKYLIQKYSIPTKNIYGHYDLDQKEHVQEGTDARAFMRAVQGGMSFNEAYEKYLNKKIKGLNVDKAKLAKTKNKDADGGKAPIFSLGKTALMTAAGGVSTIMSELGGSEKGTSLAKSETGSSSANITGKSLKGMRPNVIQMLEGLAKDWKTQTGQSLHITSAYRDPANNAAVGGAKGSKHMEGRAVDISWSMWNQETKKAFIVLAGRHGFTAFGIGNTIIHIDNSTPRSWSYKNGKPVSGVPTWAKDVIATAQSKAGVKGASMEGGATSISVQGTDNVYIPGYGLIKNADPVINNMKEQLASLTGRMHSMSATVQSYIAENMEKNDGKLEGILNVASIIK